MAAAVSDLNIMMSQTAELLDEMIFLADSQFQALREGTLPVIVYITGQQEKVSHQLGRLDLQTRSVIKDLAKETGMAFEHIDELLPHIDEPTAAGLSRQREAILARSQKLGQLNQMNAALVKQGLRYSKEMLGIINGSDSFVYNRSGDVHGASQSPRVDTKF